ncbi:MAG: 30S ribosomal protein S20 [Lacipirellulaceae bacterium]
MALPPDPSGDPAPPLAMPNSPSAKKRLRQSEDRRLQNRTQRTAVRTQIKKVRVAVKAGNLEEAEKQFRLAVKKLDKAAAKNVVHDNTAARLKSRLSKAVKGLKTPAATA